MSIADVPIRIARAAEALQAAGTTEVRLRLDPPSLGEIRVQIESAHGGIHVRIVAASAEACALLGDGQSELRQELARHGLALESFAAAVGGDAGGHGAGGGQPGDASTGRGGGGPAGLTPDAPAARGRAGATAPVTESRGLDTRA